jgi:hypothetical protein
MTLQDVRDKLEWEGGFEYFYGGSDFKEVEDEEFHRRRKALVAAWSELEEYLFDNTEDSEDDDAPEGRNE